MKSFMMHMGLSLLLLGCASSSTMSIQTLPSPMPSLPTVIASYSTTFVQPGSARAHNILKAAERLDGQVIAPGHRWSFNQIVGPRTLSRGYKIAPVLALEGLVQAEGGGICQVSSTLYNAVLLADLSMIERHPHSRSIDYVPLGRDATVSWGIKDLRIRNPHPFPVQIETRIVHNRLTVAIRASQPLPYEVRLETADSERASLRKPLQMLASSDSLTVGGLWIKLYRHRLRRGSIYQTERVGASSFYPFMHTVKE